MNALRLIVSRRGGHRYEIDVASGAVVGSGAAAGVRLPDEIVALELARFDHDGDAWSVLALAGGLVVAGTPLSPGQCAPVPAGTELIAADYLLVAAPAPAGAEPSAERTASLARELVRELLSGPSGAAPELVCEEGPSRGKRYQLPPPEARIVIGRGDQVSWVILDTDLSRAHIAIERTWDGTRVLDLESKNGTRIAGILVPVAAPGRIINDGDIIELGATRLRFIDPAEQYLRELSVRLGTALPPLIRVSGLVEDPVVAPVPRARLSLPLIVASLIAAAAMAALVWLLS